MKKIIEGLFFTYLVLFPFGQLTRIPLNFISSEVHFYMTDVVLLLLLLSWGTWRFFLVKKKYQLPPLALPIVSFSVISLLSLGVASPLLSNREVMVAGLYLVRWLVYVGLYFVIFDTKKTLFPKSNPLIFLMITGVFVALFGFVQYFLYPNLKTLEVLEWDPHFYRLVSTFLDPGFTGLILVLTLIVICISYIDISYRKKGNRWLIIVGLITYVAMILTHSRSSYLAFLVGMGAIGAIREIGGIRGKLRFFAVVLLVFGLSLALLPQPKGEGGKLTRTYTIEYRLQNWQNALTIVKDRPLLGVGFNAYRYAQRDYGFLEEEKWHESHAGAGADSSLLFVLATTGIFGFIAYLWLWWRILKTKNLIVLASGVALLIHSFFLNSLFYPWIMAWMWILLGTQEGG